MDSAILDSHLVPKGTPRERLSIYLKGRFPSLSSSNSIQKSLKRGEIRINGKIAASSHWVEEGQLIELLVSQVVPPKAYRMPLEIVFEDDYLAVLIKPAGIEVFGKKFRTLQNALLHNIKASSASNALSYPRPVHRLDYGTSGLILVAKETQALHSLSKQFENREIKKQYQAIVMGEIAEKGIINEPLLGLEALTMFERVQSFPSLKNEKLSLINAFPETGRTHQIRLHMKHIGHPILGDTLHGPPAEQNLSGKGIFLCSTGLQFCHPHTQELLHFTLPTPAKFQSLIEREQRRWEKLRSR